MNRAYWLLVILFLFGFAIRVYSFNYLYLPKAETENSWLYWYRYIYYPTYCRLDGLLMGVAIAAIRQFRSTLWLQISKYGNLFILLSLVVLMGAYFLCDEQQTFNASVFGFPLVALGYGFMVIGAVSPASFLYKWHSKGTTFIATLSYAIYLTHKGIIHMTHQVLSGYHKSDNLVLIICIINCLIVALILNRAIERPFIKLRDRIICL